MLNTVSVRQGSDPLITAPPRWWRTLAFRLALVVNLAVVGVLGVFEFSDYRREAATHLQQEAERLQEEAKVRGVARNHFAKVEEFQRFVD